MTTVLIGLVWVLVISGGIAWLVSGAALGLLIGKSIRNRDRQVPRGER